MKLGFTFTCMGLFMICALSCQKKDYKDDFTTFAPVYFINKTALDLRLQVQYNGTPMKWEQGTGKIEVPEGESVFEFIDGRNGQKLAEKKVNVTRARKDSFMVFQPTVDDPLAFLDAQGQTNESTPPAGFIKIKVANYAPSLLAFEETDIIVIGVNMNFEFINLDTLMSVTQNLGNEEFHLVPTSSDMLGYTFLFRKHGTETIVKNASGGDYMNMDNALIPDFMTPRPVKNIYTIYFVAALQNASSGDYIKVGDKSYHINPQVLYAD